MGVAETIGYAFIGGLLPALVWLYFLLKEEERCPQPRWFICIAFMAGMAAVPFVLPLEDFAMHVLPKGLPLVIAWASIEETLKYISVALVIVIWKQGVRNPVDLVITMITVALGFAALENALFLITPLAAGHFLTGLITNNLRFVGSTLLHVVACSAIGFALAFSHERPRAIRTLYATLGLILAIALHAIFNFFIIQEGGSKTILAFFLVWTGAIVFFAAFEVLKYFRYRTLPKNTC